ncbi:LamG domain-containing protein [Acinetobacter corruptisaponis]|uniref:LamG domain-containing protein n=1 Tax=Acinetobacter corruptisaponis TaxID=3045147 RepID=A0ABY8S4X2_9GAMM|nr:LamG domain-containing protein [Acinetobacter sp. KCTC 92772]WHP06750.1 LamG domain-containing protein [Acinetobacter sp. KCTC 92772]
MAGIRLEFAQFGDFDSFDVIRSLSSMVGVANIDLPSPIVTGLTTMYYVDTTVSEDTTYYYKIRVWRGANSVVSNEIKCFAGAYIAKILADHPIAYYPMNEESGGFAFDITSNPVNGTIFDCAMGQAALSRRLGKCYYFDGSSRIELGSPSKFSIASSVSLECWMKPTVLGGNTVQIGFNSGLRMQIGSAANMIFSGANKLSSSPILTINTLYHIVFTCTASELKIYINGVLAGSIAGGGWSGIGSVANSAIGYAGAGHGEYFTGYMSNIALYNYALTAEQVSEHYNVGIAA